MIMPKTFIPEKNLEKNVKELLKKQKNTYNELIVLTLLKNCEEFLAEQEYDTTILDVYNYGERRAKKLIYTKHDLEELSTRIDMNHKDDGCYLGIFLSALINKIITEEETIILRPIVPLHGVGAYLTKGRVIVDGDVGFFLGHYMEGGEMIVEGSAQHDTGNGMKGGRLVIKKDVGICTGIFMESGEIVVYGEIRDIAKSCKGNIYHKDKLVWPGTR